MSCHRTECAANLGPYAHDCCDEEELTDEMWHAVKAEAEEHCDRGKLVTLRQAAKGCRASELQVIEWAEELGL